MKKYCPKCELPMFRYPMRHNGEQVDVWRCMSVHGTQDTRGKERLIKGRTIRKGARQIFAPLYGKAIASVDP